MPNLEPDARSDPAANGDLHPNIPLLAVATRTGEPYHGGTVVRLFTPRRAEGYAPEIVAAMIVQALVAVPPHQHPRLVVLPAGIGRIERVELSDAVWSDDTRGMVRASITRWCDALGSRLPANHPPIVLGLDGAATWDSDLLSDKAVQVAVVLVNRQLAHVTAKTKPRHDGEASVLDLAWDDSANRPASDALAQHHPVVSLHGERTLLLVCFDAAAFAARSRVASSPDGTAATIAAQYDALLATPDAPRVAINLLHRLPRKPSARIITSPIFQNAHRVLGEDRGVHMIAVAGLHPDIATRAFAKLHADLACDFHSVDVLVAP
jgi:hypothetical protein